MPKEWRGKPVYQVNEIVRLLASELEQAFGDIWVEGEVSGFKRAASGHCYFSLKDDSAALKSVMFRTYAARLPFEPENGMTVLARGKLSLYEASGDLQLYVTIMEPSGVGAMQMAFEQAKRRLMEEGLTDPARKRPIPPFPRRVGVVTSVTGAALRDVLSVLRRRNAGFDVVISPALVQGASAPASLKAALAKLARVSGIEVILMTRGGGSMEDLWAFNDEGLARLVAASPVPVISAVGHEVDTVLTDFTCDLRAPTPSVAAELLTARVDAALESGQRRRAPDRAVDDRAARASGREARRVPSGAARPLRAEEIRARTGSLRPLFGDRGQSPGRADYRGRAPGSPLPEGALARGAPALDVGAGQASGSARQGLEGAMRSGLDRSRSSFEGLVRLLHSLSPLAVIGRGYAAAFDQRGRLVQNARDLGVGDEFSLALKEGGVECSVLSRTPRHVPAALGEDAGDRVDERGEKTLESGFEEADRG